MEPDTRPSKEDVDALFQSIDAESQYNEGTPVPDFSQEFDPTTELDSDAADVLNSFQKLQEEVPGLRTDAPLLSGIFSTRSENNDPEASSSNNPVSEDNPEPSTEEIFPVSEEEEEAEDEPSFSEEEITPFPLDTGTPVEELPVDEFSREDTPPEDEGSEDLQDDYSSIESTELPLDQEEEEVVEEDSNPVELEMDPISSEVETEETENSDTDTGSLDPDFQDPTEDPLDSLSEDIPDFSQNSQDLETFSNFEVPEEDGNFLEDIPGLQDIPQNENSSNSENPFSIDDPYNSGLDLKLEDIGESFYSPSSFDKELEETPTFDDSLDSEIEATPTNFRNPEESDQNVQILRKNLSILPTELALKIKNFLDNHSPESPTAKKIVKELENPSLSVRKLEKFLESPSFFRSPIFLGIGIGIFLLLSLPYIWNSLTKSPQDALLQKGLDLIHQSNIERGNEIFLNNNPSLEWYNKYASALIAKGAYDLAQSKLLGDSTSEQKGALEIAPKDKTALINLATLFIKREDYETALSPTANIEGHNAVTLSYLKEAYPKDRKVLDLVGQSYLGLAKNAATSAEKEKYLGQAYKIYSEFNKKNQEDSLALSRLLETSLLAGNLHMAQQIEFLARKGLLNTLTTDTLAKVGLHYLSLNAQAQATVFFNTLKIKKTKNPKLQFTPLAFYFLGNFYLSSGDMNSAENNLILASYGNTLKNSNGDLINVLSPSLQGQIDHSLGRVYMSLLQQYSTKTPLNEKMHETYATLADYHLQESSKYLPKDPLNYALLGDLEYNEKNYPAAIQNYALSSQLFQETQKDIPVDLSFNYGSALYKTKRYQDAIDVLTELRSQNPLVYPTVEYLLGMSYLQQRNYPQAVDRLDRALEYYQKDIQQIQQKGYTQTLEDSKKLYFNAVLNNNLGVIYETEGNRLNQPAMNAQARTYFYKALEYSKRMNTNVLLTLPDLNLQSSIFEGNVNLTNTPNLRGESSMIYDYSPDFLLEYQ